MEAQVKQRITGAVVLVVLIVIFVPALLTGPRHPKAAQQAAAALPGQPALQSYRSDLKAAPTPVGPPPSPEHSQANADDAVASVKAGESVDETPVVAKPVTPHRERQERPAPQPAAAAATTAKPTLEKSSPASGGGWAVQLGSFSSRLNAEKLVAELKRRGFVAFVADASTKRHPLFRVRAGPVKDRAAGEALLKRLKAAGHAGPVVPNP